MRRERPVAKNMDYKGRPGASSGKIFQFGKKLFGLSNFQLFIAWILLVLILSFMTPFFFRIQNFANIGVAVSVMGITAAGMTVVLISGGIDLTVGSIIGFTGIIIGKLLTLNFPLVPSIILTLLCGIGIGLINGLIIVKGSINPLITTLGMMSVVRGCAFIWAGGVSHGIVSKTFGFIGRDEIAGIPNPIIIMAMVYIFLFFVMSYTQFGRYIYSIGGNASASRRTGIKVSKNKYFFYMISGGLAALSGVLLTSLMQASLPRTHGVRA